MNEIIDIYCERMSDAFWAEPLNAVTNGAFLVSAFLLARYLKGSNDRAGWLLTSLIAAIGIGSFLFHTFARGWAALADVLPIVLFMMSAVAIGLHRRFDLPMQAGVMGAIGFLLVGAMIGFSPLAIIIPAGSVSYIPALVVLALFAIFLSRRGSSFARFFTLATLVFTVSLTLRSVDQTVCPTLPIGTHFVWHILNAVTLYLVTRGLLLATNRNSVSQ